VSEDGEVPTWSADGRWIYFIRGFHVWKVPAGAAVQAIAGEAYVAHEAPQGGDVYFAAVYQSVLHSNAQLDFAWTCRGGRLTELRGPQVADVPDPVPVVDDVEDLTENLESGAL
jgi:hypothetical protein